MLTKGVDICMSWYIASTARVSVLQPCTAKIMVLFVYIKVYVLHGLLNAYCRCDAGNTCTDAYNAETSWRIEWTSFREHVRVAISRAVSRASSLRFSLEGLLFDTERHLIVLYVRKEGDIRKDLYENGQSEQKVDLGSLES